MIGAGRKTCSKCGVEKPTPEYHRDSARTDGLRAACMTCRNVVRDAGSNPHQGPATQGFVLDFGDGTRVGYCRGLVAVAMRAPGSAGACRT